MAIEFTQRTSTRAICRGLIALLIWVPTHAVVADTMTESAKLGQQAGKDAVSGFVMPTLSADQKTLTLFPHSGKDLSVPISDLFPDSQSGNATTFTQLYGDNTATLKAGNAMHTTMESQVSQTGEAYRTLIKSANRAHPDVYNDPLWGTTDYVMQHQDVFGRFFTDCKTDVKATLNLGAGTGPDYQMCRRTPPINSRCVATHDVVLEPVILPAQGETKIASCGDGCVDIWVGKVGNNYWCSGGCAKKQQASQYIVKHPEAITSATITRAIWDDYMRIFIDDKQVWQGNNGWSTASVCEMNTNWSKRPNFDVTSYFTQTPKDGALKFNIKALVSGCGEAYAKITIRYDPAKLIIKDEWAMNDQACSTLLKAVDDGVCTNVRTTCDINAGTQRDGKYCISISTSAGEMAVCEPYFKDAPFAGVPETCTQATMTASCNPHNLPCWTNAQGVKQCVSDIESQVPQTCETLEAKGCGFIKSECVDGTIGRSGKCWLSQDTYDCGKQFGVITASPVAKPDCGETVRCMGEECVDITRTESQDFANAVAALNSAQQAAMDKKCVDEKDVTTCTVFEGTGGSCKIVNLTSTIDCCTSPSSIGIGEYIDLLYKVSKTHNVIMRLDKDNLIRGAWQTLSDPYIDGVYTPAKTAWDNVLAELDSVVDNISGECSASFTKTAYLDVISSLRNTAMEKMVTWTADVFGPEAANALFSATTSQGTTEAVDAAGNLNSTGANLQLGGGAAYIGTLLNVIMIAYAIYQIMNMIVQMIYQCEQSEYDLMAKNSVKACSYIGQYCGSKILGMCVQQNYAYCCFNSPLARILQEQIRPQLGLSFGDPKTPQCEGIPIGKLQQVNWSQVNLNEWIHILTSTGRLPSTQTPDKLTLDVLTGTGSDLNYNGDRTNSRDRNVLRLKDIDMNQTRKDAEQQGWSIGPVPTSPNP
ncbi:conjugal transfer mating pair stabilization protein TraN (plasmid) [Methylomonas sp. MED-D]|uniref:conjugal transfer mating pair stabilization protein TraN n=1 Tax=Methylomonas sp. MED-D TaxID=3418768 RepID=UPI003D05EDA4